jgi:hypothetical protein
MAANIHELKLKPTEPVMGETRGGVYLISNNRQMYFKAEGWDDVVRLVKEFEANGRKTAVQNYVEPEPRQPVMGAYTNHFKPAAKKASLDDLV